MPNSRHTNNLRVPISSVFFLHPLLSLLPSFSLYFYFFLSYFFYPSWCGFNKPKPPITNEGNLHSWTSLHFLFVHKGRLYLPVYWSRTSLSWSPSSSFIEFSWWSSTFITLQYVFQNHDLHRYPFLPSFPFSIYYGSFCTLFLFMQLHRLQQH